MIKIIPTTAKCANGCDAECGIMRIEIGACSVALCLQCRQDLISDLKDATEEFPMYEDPMDL